MGIINAIQYHKVEITPENVTEQVSFDGYYATPLGHIARGKPTNEKNAILKQFVDMAKSIGKIDYPIPEDHQKTLLSIASEWCNVEAVEYLLENGADPNTKDSMGATPLIHAVSSQVAEDPKDCLKVAETLLAHGADPNIRDKYKYTALMYVTPPKFLKKGPDKTEIEIFLRENGAKEELLDGIRRIAGPISQIFTEVK